jgi:hypothetical protein
VTQLRATSSGLAEYRMRCPACGPWQAFGTRPARCVFRGCTLPDERVCEECMTALATNHEWGAWLCDECTAATDRAAA